MSQIDISKDLKRAERKAKIKQFLLNVKDFYVENPELAGLATLGITGAIGVGVKLCKTGISSAHHARVAHIEQHRRDFQIYDNQLGSYLNLNRKLSNNDKVRIARRKKNGETLVEILDSMGALK